MKIRYLFSVLFALLAAAVIAAALHISFTYRDTTPMLLEPPAEAESCMVSFLDAVCAGNYGDAEDYLYGTPSLGVDREPADTVSRMIWNAFVESLSWEMTGQFYATDDGLARDVCFTSLDIDSVTAPLRERSRALLEKWVEEAEDTSQIYDENNDYREELVMLALEEAAGESLAQDALSRKTVVTVNLVFRDDRWQIVSDAALLDAISGGIVG